MTTLFVYNGTAPTEIYTLSLHDALPISRSRWKLRLISRPKVVSKQVKQNVAKKNTPINNPIFGRCIDWRILRSEEHTSELQSLTNLVCRLLLEKKKRTDSASDHPLR